MREEEICHETTADKEAFACFFAVVFLERSDLMKKRTYLFLFMSVLMTVFIFRNSAKTSVESGEASGKVLELVMFFFPFAGKLADADTITHIIRKTAHFTEFFCQGLFFCGTFLFDRKKNVEKVVCVLFCGLLTACADELLQHFVQGRSDEVVDIWIDFAGTLLAAAVYCAVSGLVCKIGRKKK